VIAAEGRACLARLAGVGLVVEEAATEMSSDPRCVVESPVRLTAARWGNERIAFPDRPIIACSMAETFVAFTEGLLEPLVRGTFDARVTQISTGPGFECRPRNRVEGAKLSAHGQGLAIDIAGMTFADGRQYVVGAPRDDRDRAFDRAVRAAGCGYFHTALGPGADPSHADHWHFDVEPRGSKGNSKFCQ